MTIAFITVHTDDDYGVIALDIRSTVREQYVVDDWESALALLSATSYDRLHIVTTSRGEDTRDFLDDSGGY